MPKKRIQMIFGTFFLIALAFIGTGCGGCGEGETEVCGVLQSFEKNGIVDDCVCVQAECLNDADCQGGFLCINGLCAAQAQ